MQYFLHAVFKLLMNFILGGLYMSDNIRIINDSEMTHSDGWEYRRVLPRHLIYFDHTSSVTHTRARGPNTG